MNATTLISIANSLLVSAGTALVANGTFTSQQWQQVVGGILALASAIAAHFAHGATSTPNAAPTAAQAKPTS